jgi:pimeloyl-ACP methyl ester carboxylesterase
VKESARRWLRRVFLALALVYLVLVFGVLPWWLGRFVTTRRFEFPDRENAGLTPASFDLPFEDVSFNAPDGVTLDGWWVPSPDSAGTVILVHGLNRSRVEMVRKAPFLHRLGWNALAFDLRHHGASGGDASTFGFLEKDDVRAAVALARQRAPEKPVVLWGVSLGAASAALAAAEDPAVSGLVCDSSYRSLRDTVRHHVRLFRGFRWWSRLVPAWPVDEEVVFWIGRAGGFDPDAVDVRQAVPRLADRPVLFVCNSGDRRMPQEIAFELKAAAGEHARVLVVPGNSHGGAYRDGTAAYERNVTEVLREARERTARSVTPVAAERSRP